MKQDLLSNALMFAAGAAIGSVVTWVAMKRKYEAVEYDYETEIEMEESEEEESEPSKDPEENLLNSIRNAKKEDMVRYNKIAEGYRPEENTSNQKEVGEDVEKSYPISVDEYAEFGDYETITLYYYADGVLTDEEDNVIEEDIVGEDALKEFEDENCQSVYVRNDARKCDYEILRDLDKYSDKYHTEV